ncbi:MAG: hypothetical protein KF830_18390, partial [Planctomycetes bacterium]|nr:hypothetical protein [Planctomycetota bacterium]
MFLGLDVGGTRCRAEWWPPEAASGHDAPGVQPAVHGPDAAMAALAMALATAAGERAPVAAVCA